MPYDDQLKLKAERHQSLVKRLVKLSPPTGVPQTAPIVPSDVLTEYRGKDEFGIQRVSKRHLPMEERTLHSSNRRDCRGKHCKGEQ
jgi:hypothetical protein